jgi:nondiscriminating glutamyl-tRNA synthetase
MFNLFKPQVRTRFAPSPTGYLHIGGLRTALYAYLWAKKNKGTFFLRIEDTDQSREVKGAVGKLLNSLKLTGVIPDEGVISESDGKIDEKGHFGPYTQSQRLDIYQKYVQKLIESGQAYYCFCTPERLEELRKKQELAKQPTKYDGLCKKLSTTEIKKRINAGEKYVIRMKVPTNQVIEFNDLVRGRISVHSKEIDDQVLMKADGFPTYHLAHVVDDHLMKTTLVIRGEEWLPSTPKHLLLFSAFDWPAPQYVHLSLILNPDKTKLSKRQGDVAIEDYLDKGYLPEALVNYVALLGWNPGTEQEIFSLPELIEEFSFAKIHKAGAVFDIKKLNWINGEYLKKMPINDFVKLAQPYLEKNIKNISPDLNLNKILAIEQQRINRLNEVGEGLDFFFTNNLEFNPQILIWKKSSAEGAINCLNILLEELEKQTDWTKEKLQEFIINLIKERGLSNGEVLWPFRVALTGQEKSPTPFEIAEILGQEKTLTRIKQAVEKLSKSI